MRAYLGNWIDGRFVLPAAPNGEWVGHSPADSRDELGRFTYSFLAVDEAVAAARAALPMARRSSWELRVGWVRALQRELRERSAELVELLGLEVGKPRWEAEEEVAQALTEMDVQISETPREIAAQHESQEPHGTQGATSYRPLGAVAIIGPFNSPVLYPCSHLVPVLLAGNTAILKPSEKAPLTSQLLAECLRDAGVPAGVFNLLQGEKEIGRRLCVHEGVDGVFFTGSYDVGVRIKQDTLQQHWKRLVLEMGAKNSILVWKDADLESAVRSCLVSAFVSAGQRCTSASRVIVHSSLVDRFVDLLHEKSKAFTIGHPNENPFMGPLIDHGSVDRYMKFLGIAAREGAALVMRGKALELAHPGFYVTPSIVRIGDASIEATRRSVFQQTEYFAPCLSVSPVDELDHAIGLANLSQYGLVSSIFSASRAVFEQCRDELQTGWIHWNRPSIETSPRLPSLGRKKSGNHFASGSVSARNCALPVSSLENPDASKISDFLGLNWEK